MGVIRTNRTSIVAGGLISASYVSDVYNVLTANAIEDIVLSGSLSVSGSLTASSNAVISGSLTVTGSLTVSGSNTLTNIGSFINEGSFTQTGTSFLTGNTSITTASIGVVSSSLIPGVDTNYDLGSSTKEWKDLYIDGTANMDTVSSSAVHISATTASLHVSGALADIIFTNLPQVKPTISGSLWLSGSAGQSSKYLVVYTG